MKIGTLTIGQSPRVDIVPKLKEPIGFEVEIEEKGALDDLTWKEVKDLYPGSDDYILVTRIRAGKEVKIPKRHVIERMKEYIADVKRIDVDFMVILCTGILPEDIISKKLILKPSKLLENMLGVILQEGVIAVIVLSAGQISLCKESWERINPNLKVIVESAPYPGTDEEIEKVAERIAKTDVNLVIFDCLGFNKKIKTILRKITRKPVLLPRTLLGRMGGELIAR